MLMKTSVKCSLRNHVCSLLALSLHNCNGGSTGRSSQWLQLKGKDPSWALKIAGPGGVAVNRAPLREQDSPFHAPPPTLGTFTIQQGSSLGWMALMMAANSRTCPRSKDAISLPVFAWHLCEPRYTDSLRSAPIPSKAPEASVRAAEVGGSPQYCEQPPAAACALNTVFSADLLSLPTTTYFFFSLHRRLYSSPLGCPPASFFFVFLGQKQQYSTHCGIAGPPSMFFTPPHAPITTTTTTSMH